MKTDEDHMNRLWAITEGVFGYAHETRDAARWALAELARLSKPRSHVVKPAVDHFGHVRCIGCGHAYAIHDDTCFRHEQLKREGKVSDFPREVFLGMIPQPTEGGQS